MSTSFYTINMVMISCITAIRNEPKKALPRCYVMQNQSDLPKMLLGRLLVYSPLRCVKNHTQIVMMVVNCSTATMTATHQYIMKISYHSYTTSYLSASGPVPGTV